MPMRKLAGQFAILLAGFALSAQPSNSSFIHYTSDQGLSNDHITGIVKDHMGFLWISTVNGLNRFDGKSFKIFHHDPKDVNSLPDDQIKGITLAPDGGLWIATLKGLCTLNTSRLTIQRIPLPVSPDPGNTAVTTTVAFDSKGMAWTTGDEGMYQINPADNKVEYFYRTPQKTLGWFGMLIDKDDRIWLMKDTLRRFDPVTQRMKLFQGADPTESLVDAGVLSLVTDDQGQIWAGTWSSGIWKYDAGSDEFVRGPLPQTLSMMLLPDTSAGKDFFWVGGGKSGLAIYVRDTRQYIEFTSNPEDRFTHNNYLATTFFKDPLNGDVWIGTEVGLEHYAPATLRFGRAMIPPEKDMSQFSLVSGVVHDHTDPTGQRYFVALWGSGLFAWNKSTGIFTRMRSSTSRLTGGGNFNLFQDRIGHLWGCMYNGLGRHHPKTGEWRDYENFFQHPEKQNLIWCGLEDRKGDLWFGSNREGLFRYNPHTDRIEQVLYDPKWANDAGNLNITGISEDSLGRLWLACNVSLLIRYDPATGEVKQFSYSDYNIPNTCNAVEVGRNGRVYACFYSTFLELDLDGNLLRHFTQQNGLRANRLSFIVEDRQGKIWFNSVHLLHCFDPASGTFQYYGKPDGLFSNSMTDALSITPSGEIFVGFQNAFNFFYPDRLRRNLQPPPVAITSIKVMNKERQVVIRSSAQGSTSLFPVRNKDVGQDTFLTLKPGEDFFEIEFAALNFNQQERNRYAYVLEGFNKDWVYTDRPVATFTNLDGGQYLLRMKASNNDGIWNEQGASIYIRVNPPIYRTWWFFILIALAVAGVGAGMLWFRRQQRLRLEKFRESLARDLHDEMGSTLSSIRFFSDFANQQIGSDKPQVTPMLQRISQSASSLSESMQDIIWAMKTKHDQLEDLAVHMTEFALGLLEARNVNFITNISEDFSGKHLPPEVRRNIYLIFKEAVNNAAKYSDATEVTLDLSLHKGMLRMRIRDNGKGFEPEGTREGRRGNGIQNMRKRAAEIGGSLEVVSSPGKGTNVEVLVKM